MPKGNRLKLVLIPVLVGLVVTLIAHQALQSRAPVPVVEVTRVPIVVAAKPIPARVKLTAEMLAIRQIPEEAIVGTEYAEPQVVVGQISTVPLAEGEVLLPSKVVEEGKGALPYRIPEGQRAVTIAIDEVSGVGGFPDAGDRVDLILFLDPQDQSNEPATARLLLEDLLVLARGPNEGERAPRPDEGIRMTSLTLAMRPEEAVEVALGEQLGHLKAILRRALPDPNRGSFVITESQWQSGPGGP